MSFQQRTDKTNIYAVVHKTNQVLQRLRGFAEAQFRQLSLKVFGTATTDRLKSWELLPKISYSTKQFGMLCLEQETYKFPVSIRRNSCNDGSHTQPCFRYTYITNGFIAGNGRVLDSRSRLVNESIASHHSKVGNPGFLRTRKVRLSPGVALNLNWWSGNGNIFHWNRDVLSRAFVMTALKNQEQLQLVVPSDRLPYQDHSINRLLQMFPNSTLVEQEFSEWSRYENVIVPTCNSQDIGSGFLHPQVADFVRSVNLYGIQLDTTSIPVLYISRRKSRHRRILDEENLIEELSRVAPVKVACLEDYSYPDQMQLMGSVEVLVGPYGAGLTHLLFTKRHALIEIHNGDSKETHFATMALACGAKYVQIQGLESDIRQDFKLGLRGIRDVCESTLHYMRGKYA